jgi:hypothetical protein
MHFTNSTENSLDFFGYTWQIYNKDFIMQTLMTDNLSVNLKLIQF